MALTNPELEAITRDYFAADGKKAVDIYFETSWFMDHFMKGKKGLFKMPNGGFKIKVPLKYDGAESGFYQRNDALSETDRVNITAAYFEWKHAFGNATIYRADELQNAGEYAEVEYVTSKIEDAMESCRDSIASNIYSANGDSGMAITGLQSLCNETTTAEYGGLTEAEVVATDGTTPWEGKMSSSAAVISLDAIRKMRRDAKVRGGSKGKPDIGLTTDVLFDKVASVLTTQQRFTNDTPTAEAGFQNLVIEGLTLVVDDYCPSGYLFTLNSKHIGFAVHSKGYFARTPWSKLTSGQVGRTMKILWDGNIICDNRRAHHGHSGLTAS